MRDLVLRSAESLAIIRPFGAELRAWRVRGVDLLWTPDPKVWPAVSPVLFPIVGRLRNDRLRVGERVGALGTHGFAAHCCFEIESRADDAVRLVLRDNESTRAAYPFSFRLAIDYRLGETDLCAQIEVENVGSGDLPYACGLHPGFAWPFDEGPADEYFIDFEKAERPETPEISSEGLFERTRRATPLKGCRLPLARGLFAREALCFLDLLSRSFRFVSPTGRAIGVEMSDFPHAAFWTRPPAPYLCLETWTGHGDPSDFDGDVFEKPSIRLLPAGRRATHAATYRFEDAL